MSSPSFEEMLGELEELRKRMEEEAREAFRPWSKARAVGPAAVAGVTLEVGLYEASGEEVRGRGYRRQVVSRPVGEAKEGGEVEFEVAWKAGGDWGEVEGVEIVGPRGKERRVFRGGRRKMGRGDEIWVRFTVRDRGEP